MSDGQPRHNWAGVIGPWLAIIVILLGVVARFISLEEADGNKTEIIARLVRQVDDLQHERAAMAETLGRIEVRVDVLSIDMRDVKGDVKEINGKLPKRGR